MLPFLPRTHSSSFVRVTVRGKLWNTSLYASVCVCLCAWQKGLQRIGRLDGPAESFSTDFGKSLLHIFSSHDKVEKKHAWLSELSQGNAFLYQIKHIQNKSSHMFLSVYSVIIYRRSLRSVLRSEAKQQSVSQSCVYSAPGHCSIHLRGKCYDIYAQSLLTNFDLLSHSCVPQLKIFPSSHLFLCIKAA